MAHVRDLRTVLRRVGPFRFGKRVLDEVGKDDCFGWSAALAYSYLFAIFPFFIFLITLTPYLPERAKSDVKEQLHSTINRLPNETAKYLWDNVSVHLDDVLSKPRSGLLGAGIFVTLWAASGGMAMTMQALDRAASVQVRRHFVRQRGTAIILTSIVASLILAVIVLLPVTSLVLRWIMTIPDQLPSWARIPKIAFIFAEIGRITLAIGLMLLTVSLIYHYGTYIKRRFTLVTPGSLFCVIGWVLLGFGFRIYVEQFGKFSKTYGAVSSVIVLLLFFYLCSLFLLIGAEINAEIDKALKEHPAAPPMNPGPRPDVAPMIS